MHACKYVIVCEKLKMMSMKTPKRWVGRRAVSLRFDCRRLVVMESSPACDALSVIISIILRLWGTIEMIVKASVRG